MAVRVVQSKNLTASAVISPNVNAILRGVIFNSSTNGATVQFFDDTTTSSPSNPIGGVWTLATATAPASFNSLDIACTKKGLTCVISGTCDITVEFS